MFKIVIGVSPVQLAQVVDKSRDLYCGTGDIEMSDEQFNRACTHAG